MEIIDFYNSLLTATFGGVPFSVVDTRQEVGRRVQRFLFPGVDDAAFQDLGADDGPISIRGLLVGEDYIGQVAQLRAVFRAPGPYQLVHPWLGTIQVVLAQRPIITLSARELQVARFEALLFLFNSSITAGLDTLSQLETQIDKLTADAQNWFAAAISPAVGAVAAFGYAQSWLSNAATLFGQAVSITASAGEIGPATAGEIAGLTNAIAAPMASFPATAAASLAATVGAFADSSTPTAPSAVAPGGSTTAAAAADPTDAATTLLSVLPGIAASASGPAPAPAMAAALSAMVVAGAVQAATNIIYASQQDALAEQATLNAAIDQAAAAAGVAAATDPLNATPVWRDLIALKAALAADMNALIGRLPAVVTINTPRTMPVWLLAHYISGDTPSQIVSTYLDIIARNKVRHPALLPPGAIEVLNS